MFSRMTMEKSSTQRGTNIMSTKKLELGMTVYHTDIYHGQEPMKIVGIREKEVELEGDYSGGITNLCQKDWQSRSGVLIKKAKPLIKEEYEAVIKNMHISIREQVKFSGGQSIKVAIALALQYRDSRQLHTNAWHMANEYLTWLKTQLAEAIQNDSEEECHEFGFVDEYQARQFAAAHAGKVNKSALDNVLIVSVSKEMNFDKLDKDAQSYKSHTHSIEEYSTWLKKYDLLRFL